MNDPQEVAKLLVSRLVERRDAKALQTPDGGYRPVRQRCAQRCGSCEECQTLVPWALRDVVDHVTGERTYGHYIVDPATSACRTFVFDIDLRKKANPATDPPEEPIVFDGEEIDPREVWAGPVTPARVDLGKQLQGMAHGLASATTRLLGIPVLVSYSGNKGMHVYGCIDRGTPAAEARELARMVLESTEVMIPDHGANFFKHHEGYRALQVEVFPKQDKVSADGFGNLVRLPLGIHRKTGKPSFFIKLETELRHTKKDDPMTALTEGSIR